VNKQTTFFIFLVFILTNSTQCMKKEIIIAEGTEKSTKIKHQIYKSNKINLLDTEKNKKINKKLIQANSIKVIIKSNTRGNKLIITYFGNTIDIFDMQSGNKTNTRAIEANPNKKIIGFGNLDNNESMLYVQYSDKEIVAFDIYGKEKLRIITEAEATKKPETQFKKIMAIRAEPPKCPIL